MHSTSTRVSQRALPCCTPHRLRPAAPHSRRIRLAVLATTGPSSAAGGTVESVISIPLFPLSNVLHPAQAGSLLGKHWQRICSASYDCAAAGSDALFGGQSTQAAVRYRSHCRSPAAVLQCCVTMCTCHNISCMLHWNIYAGSRFMPQLCCMLTIANNWVSLHNRLCHSSACGGTYDTLI
jgi:hypothetical protein